MMYLLTNWWGLAYDARELTPIFMVQDNQEIVSLKQFGLHQKTTPADNSRQSK
jgi:hypothetical protein